MTLPTISASKLKTFKKCARLYFYKYIQTVRQSEDKNTAALLGTSIHKAIEMYYKSQEDPYVTFQENMITTLNEWNAKKYIVRGEDNVAKYMKDGKQWLEQFEWSFYNPIELEYPFTYPFPRENPICLITGYIDHIDSAGFIVDHKSQKIKPNVEELSQDVQFIIYYWAFEQTYGFPPEKIYWNHIRTGERIEVDIHHNYLFKLEQLEYDVIALLKNTEYQRREQSSDSKDFCRTICSYYKNCYGKKLADIEEE